MGALLLILGGGGILWYVVSQKGKTATSLASTNAPKTSLSKKLLNTFISNAPKALPLLGGAGAAAAAGGGAAALGAGGVTTVVVSSGALPAAIPLAGGAVAPGGGIVTGGGVSATGAGIGTAAATVGLLAAPFVLGPLLAHAIGGKTFKEWEEEQARAAKQYQEMVEAGKKAMQTQAEAEAIALRNALRSPTNLLTNPRPLSGGSGGNLI